MWSLTLGLAGSRLTAAVAIDEVTQPVRNRVKRWAEDAGDPDSPFIITKRMKRRLYAAKLISCQLCAGWWITMIMSLVATAVAFNIHWVLDIVLALSSTGVQRLIAIREMPPTPD